MRKSGLSWAFLCEQGVEAQSLDKLSGQLGPRDGPMMHKPLKILKKINNAQQ
jgi:hypothetical protein